MNRELLQSYQNYTLAEAHIPELPNYYRGKVRENYDLPDGKRIFISSDRISAFDVNLAVIPLKGMVLTKLANFWFDNTADICPNHVVDCPDANVIVGKRLNMMPVEIVVRDSLAGSTGTSILQMYQKGKRDMYGHVFPDNMRANQKLPHAIITPTTKAGHGDHDAPLSAAQVVEQKLLTQKQWDEVSALALKLFARGQEVAATRDLILVDTKYEFGFDENGRIVLADEVHTPDSSRYWKAKTYQEKFEKNEGPETLDKDFIRRWVTARCDPYKDKVPEIPADVIMQAAEKYIEVYEAITRQAFALPPLSPAPLQRIRANLQKYIKEAA
jgi:phosphoribosylaminoimidazole-succinocarboxamide synthase